MPRVRAAGTRGSPLKTSQIPLNDDRHEKAQRLQSRHELYAKQMNKIKAAVSPARKRKSLGEGPNTPQQDDDDAFGAVAGSGVTPMKRVPILANFEEWMRMATDNKINAANSWNFALIDYFHDMSLLKEGDGVNFQKASCTLDGCVKIYTSRVDSVATETGKLLSGLADSNNKKGHDQGDAGGEGDEDEDDENGTQKKSKKKSQRSAEATLVESFDQIRLKKMELEFAVDPLFKKASADFDEGGAKGLLLNHLSIDSTGRIVFDSSDDAAEHALDDTRRDSMDPQEEDEQEKSKLEVKPAPSEHEPIDIARLAAQFFPDLDKLDQQDICPSLKTFELGGGDGSLDLPFLKAPENWRDEQPDAAQEKSIKLEDGAGLGMGDDEDGGYDVFDMGPEPGFGEGGEAWAKTAALQPQLRTHDGLAGGDDDGDADGAEVGTFDAGRLSHSVTLQHKANDQDNILSYFDDALKKNWAGPEHWKITRVKEANKPQVQRTRKEKEPFEVDFAAPMSQELANMLYTSATSNSAISLPRTQWKSKTRNLLPDDKHFNSKDLLKLFLKPKAKLALRRGTRSLQPSTGDVDVAYWAANSLQGNPHATDDAPVQGDYDANFFQDDNLPIGGDAMDDDDDEFADARETFSPDADDAGAAGGPTGPGIDGIAMASTQEGSFGAQLVTQSRRSRPEYVQYARVAKKVDIRRLKDEMWCGTGFEKKDDTTDTPIHPARPQAPVLAADDNSTLQFTAMMKNLQHVYPQQQLADISTSYGFICLLHLANEKGLVIENVDGFEDLRVRKDFNAPLISSEA